MKGALGLGLGLALGLGLGLGVGLAQHVKPYEGCAPRACPTSHRCIGTQGSSSLHVKVREGRGCQGEGVPWRARVREARGC